MKIFERDGPLLIWSSFLALIAALLLRLLHVQFTALLLKVFSIGFNPHFFSISYENSSGGHWTDGRVFGDYFFGTLIFMFLGLLVSYMLEKVRIKNVKLRLFFTWLSFFSVFLFPVQLLSGAFVHDELGLGMSWFLPGWLMRLVVALFFVGASMFLRAFWIRMFIKSAHAIEVINDYGKRRRFVRTVFLKAMLVAAFMIALFAISAGSLTWFLVNAFMLLIVVVFAAPILPAKTPRIIKTNHTFNLSRPELYIMLAATAGLFILSFF